MPIMKPELNNLQNEVVEIPRNVHLNKGELICGFDGNSSEYLPQSATFFHFQNFEHKLNEENVTKSESFMSHMDLVQPLAFPSLETPFLKENVIVDDAINGGDSAVTIFSLLKNEIDGHACETTNIGVLEDDKIADVPQGIPFNFADNGDFADIIQSFSISQMEISLKTDSQTVNKEGSSSIRKKGIVLSQTPLSATELPFVQQNQHSFHSSELKIFPTNKENPKHQVVCEKSTKGLGPPKKKQLSTRDEYLAQLKSNAKKTVQMRNNKEKLDCFNNKRKNPIPTTKKEVKLLPNFDSFIVEEEEGSGGYGTVYRAQMKEDGKTFAIKCPHAKANKHHVHNELKMLERFGGKNFVIKYEGSFKNEDSECIVLEHVEHDRPEVLKREIDVFQLQWYGYCMFKALAGLHKQGIVHRDIKPGNFLFSRKFNKGFLIDFNLALDLHHKYGKSDKSTLTSNKVSLPLAKSTLDVKQNLSIGNSQKPVTLSKNRRKKSGELKDGGPDLVKMDSKNGLKSQGENGSGLTSTRTPGEKLKEPVPCQGRKELLNFVQKAMHTTTTTATTTTTTNEPFSLASSKRKRVSALPGRTDKKIVYLTPMSLHSHGIPVAGAGPAQKKGYGKHKQEGPCVGTKGFRAPEVLLRSAHQGTKLDIWSAGVTLLYFLIGKAPFTGEPDQNIKEIAKLRGSEDLWELAKLHDREASFPSDLLDTEFLQSTNVQEWCKKNTKRIEFLEQIPESLIDLLDKCLTVNPRIRLSAEEALRHPFFETCHEQLRKYRQRKEKQQQK
ncbi:cell division cycle 7-related protein kinase-like [Impatiens glandulifera]|uniref:cell division cycle 7-related protein kinase-like n=1 Tax=Impatiens glandulifera TaxID=253017 RepID=UPI001FB0D00A|nr:cell division cycle 7-related protein kinase-like [Impatiens glandulifera]